MADIEQLTQEYQQLIDRGEPVEQVLLAMRHKGLTVLEAVKLTKRLYHLGLKEAQRRVVEHPAWADEAHKVLSLDDIVESVAANPRYFAWLEWYSVGVDRKGMLHVQSRDIIEQQALEERLRAVARAGSRVQRQFMEELASQPETNLDALIAIVSNYAREEQETVILALQTIQIIGHPKNAAALSWMVYLASDLDAPGRQQATTILKEIPAGEVIPYFLAALLNDQEESLSWAQTVNGICTLLKEKHEWLVACSPAVTYQLARYDNRRKEQPDPLLLLDVLAQTIPACTYAIPSIYHLAWQEKESEVGFKAQQLLSLFDEQVIRPYRYHLQLLRNETRSDYKRS